MEARIPCGGRGNSEFTGCKDVVIVFFAI